MIYGLLAKAVPEGGKVISVGEAVIDALIGYIVVFAGIAILVGIVKLVGMLMQKLNGVPLSKKDLKEVTEQATKTRKEEEQPTIAETSDDELSEETIAVITAAIAAYYEQNNRNCGFTVRRIKRI